MKKIIAIAAAAVAILPFTASPAPAAGAGNVVITCKADLPQFPTDNGNGTCNGTVTIPAPLPGTAVGGLAGVDTSGATPEPFVLTTAPGVSDNFSASFQYNEGCVAGEPPVLGSAFNATATITGLQGTKGDQNVTGSATVEFEWTRAGLTAAIQITGGTLSLSDGYSAPLVGAGAGAFVPFLTVDNTCDGNGPLKAYVVANATLAAL